MTIRANRKNRKKTQDDRLHERDRTSTGEHTLGSTGGGETGSETGGGPRNATEGEDKVSASEPTEPQAGSTFAGKAERGDLSGRVGDASVPGTGGASGGVVERTRERDKDVA